MVLGEISKYQGPPYFYFKLVPTLPEEPIRVNMSIFQLGQPIGVLRVPASPINRQ